MAAYVRIVLVMSDAFAMALARLIERLMARDERGRQRSSWLTASKAPPAQRRWRDFASTIRYAPSSAAAISGDYRRQSPNAAASICGSAQAVADNLSSRPAHGGRRYDDGSVENWLSRGQAIRAWRHIFAPSAGIVCQANETGGRASASCTRHFIGRRHLRT